MTKFLLKIFLFFTFFAAVDIISGYVFSFIRSRSQKGSETLNSEIIANRLEDDIIILGSSRALHHYNPQVFTNILGLTCHNCGEGGHGIIFEYGRYKMLTSRYTPKLIIYELTPSFDYGKEKSYSKYLGKLRPYYDKEGIKDIFKDFDSELTELKMVSNMFKNNSMILPYLFDFVKEGKLIKGYSPLYGQIHNYIVEESPLPPDIDIDSLKYSYLEKMVLDAQSKKIPIVFAMSPIYGSAINPGPEYDYRPAMHIFKKYNILFFNYLHYEPIALNQSYFHDGGHMNDDGANAYSALLAKQIAESLSLCTDVEAQEE